MITVSIAGVDRTSLIKANSLSVTDRVNQASDVAEFTIQKFGDRTYVPSVGAEVLIEDSVRAETIYAGVIIAIDQALEGHTIVNFTVRCKDYTHTMDRRLVRERYESTNLKAIIDDLIYRYTEGEFTTDAVEGSTIAVGSVSFNDIRLSDCLEKLAKLTGYSWYVGYDKDVHFFKKNSEVAPFSLSDTSENFIYDSLIVRSDFSQIRNRVKVTGGEAISDARTEKLAGDGERDTFPLANKFSDLPTVTVDGVPVYVGVDFLQKDEDYAVMWSFQQKYLRFTTGNIPGAPTSGETNIEVSGTPLRPIVVQRGDSVSIGKYGVYEHAIVNDSVRSRDEALQLALTDLQRYADSVRGGSFETYTPGLKSGQTIQITSSFRGISETFLIQAVRFTMITPETYKWTVEIASVKTLSMIDILQKLLMQERLEFGEDETLLEFFQFTDTFTMADVIGTPTTTPTEDYYVEQDDPGSDSETQPAIVNKSTMSS